MKGYTFINSICTLVVLILINSLEVNAQCANQTTMLDEQFEGANPIPGAVTANIYGGGAWTGANYILSGTQHGWFNVVNGVGDVDVYDRFVDGFCPDSIVNVSYWIRESFGGTNVTVSIIDDLSTVLATSTIALTGVYQQFNYSFPATTPGLRFVIHCNSAGSPGGVDICVEDILITQCMFSHTEDVNYTGCSPQSMDLFSVFSDTVLAGGTWSGPSVLANGSLGTFDPSINSGGLYTYTVTTPCLTLVSTVIMNTSPISDTLVDQTILCADDSVMVSVSASGGTEPYTYTWSDPLGQVGDTAYLPSITGVLTGVIDYYVTITDSCGFTNMDTVSIILNQTLAIDTIMTGPASSCLSDGWVFGEVTGRTDSLGVVLYHWEGPYNSGANSIDASAMDTIPTGMYYFTVQDDVCTITDSAFVEVINAPIADFSVSDTIGCTPLVVEFENTSEYSTSYDWVFGNGQVLSVDNPDNQTTTYLADATAYLIAYDVSGCADTSEVVNIIVLPCGCTDPSADNYNSQATMDDGTCIYPLPVIIAPNIFTPNGDNVNDFFEFETKNIVQVELVIINRWGNVVFDEKGLNPMWDGKNAAGNLVDDGTYFYKYIGYGINGANIDGHGFVQVTHN